MRSQPGVTLLQGTQGGNYRAHTGRRVSQYILCCCGKYHDLKQLDQERVYLAYKLKSINEGSQGKNPRQQPKGTEAQTMEEHCLLALPKALFQLPFLSSPGPHVQGQYGPQWAGPSYINQQLRQCLTNMTTGHSYGNSSSTEVASFLVCKIDSGDQPSQHLTDLLEHGALRQRLSKPS